MSDQEERAGLAESENSGEAEQIAQGQGVKFSAQDQDQEEFQLIVTDLFYRYDPQSVLDEAAVIQIANAVWLKRGYREFNSETRQLDQEIYGALRQLGTSKAIQRAQPSEAIGITRNIRRGNRSWGLIGREGIHQMQSRRRSREIPHLLPPIDRKKEIELAALEASKLPLRPEDNPLHQAIEAWKAGGQY